jgi:hypothetical protein
MLAVKRLLTAIEPWYDWSAYGLLGLRDDTCVDGHHVTLEWFGFHIMLAFGRLPAKAED